MRVVKTPPPPLPVPSGSKTTTTTTVPKAPSGTIIPQLTTQTTVPQPLVGQPPVTTPPAGKTTVTTLSPKKGAPPLPIPSPVPVQENVPATGRTGMVIPSVKTPPGYTTSPDLYETRLKLGQATIESLREGVPKEQVEAIVSGEEKKGPGGWRGALANIINFDIIPGKKFEYKPVESLVIKPLTTIDVGRRALVSGFRESVELAKDITEGKQVYKPTDYIPVHKQTGLPIAKVGDPVISNWERIINTPIPNIEKINTYEEAQKAQDKIVEETATTTSGSFKDLVRQTKDVTTGFGDIPYIQTGNKWVDRAIGFFGDVVLDPTTYLAGPGALAKEPLEAAAKAGVKRTAVELAQQAIKDTSAELATRVAAREAAEAAAKEAADYVDKLAAAATESAVKTPIITGAIPESAAIIREAEQRAALAAERAAAAQAAETAAREAADAAKATALTAGAGVKAAEKAVTQAQRQAPRRVYGAGARETLANTVRGIRKEALNAATNASLPMVERVAAEKAARVLSDDLIADIAAKGYSVIKGDAAKLLGVRPGLRIGIPTFAKYTIPGTGPFTSIIGKGVAGRRLWFVNTPKGAAILNKFMGAPEGGILGEADILTLRQGLSQGTIKGPEAVDAVALLAADKAYRGQLNLLRKEGVAIINGLRKEIPNFPKIARKLAPYFETPEASWGTRGLKALNADERAVYDSFQQIFNDTFAQADRRARSLGGAGLTKLDTYFPHVQSAAALQWAARNRKLADKTAEALGIDTLTLLSGNYLDRMLVPGKTWFGYTLQPADIAGGVTRLNEIARQYGKLKFDFFATDAGEVLAKYLDNHSRFMSYTGAIQNLPRLTGGTSRGVPTVFDTKYIPSDVIKELTAKIARDEAVDTTALAARLARNAADLPLIADALKSVESRIINLMRPDKLVNWSPEKIGQVRNLIDAIGQRLTRDTVVKREVAALVEELDNQIIETTRLIDAGVIDPAVGGMLLDEAEHMATSLVDDIGRVRAQFVGTPKERWAGARELAKLGFESINAGTMPNIYAQREVASMLSNLKQLDDTKFAKYADMLLSDLTIMSKGYLTGSLGFHVRNALGGIFTLAAAGGRMDYLYEAVKIQRKLESNLKKGISYVETIKTLSPAEREIVTLTASLSGATGFGQFGEIAQAAGAGRTGITGRTATGLTPFAGRRVPFGGGRVIPGAQVPIAGRASAAVYKPLRYLREKGSALEQTMRFALLYDGIKQGLNPLEAANRVNKYLIDYGSPTKLDRQMRSVYTFWTWMSRNLPLQIENMWMAPSAYQKYLSFRRNMQDKDGESPFLPEYLKETGAFKIPFGESIYARPDLGFPGASAPNLLQQAASGDVYEVLSGLTPALRVALENEINKQLFSGAPLRSEFKSDKENAQAFRSYLYSQLLSPAGLIGRYLSAIPGDEPKWLQTLTGSKLDRELNTTLSLLGAPGFKLRSIEERNEILRRYYLLQEKKNRAIQNNQPPEE